MPTAFWLLVDFLIIYYVVYRILLIIKGTRAVPMLIGLLVLAVIYGLSQHVLNLPTFTWLLEQFIGSILIIVVVLFQADIRRALASFGRPRLLGSFRSGEGAQVVDELVKASSALAAQKIGALVAVQREADLGPYLEDATRVDAKLSKDLLYSLFVPERQNPLHDGAVVVREGRLDSAGVFLPMSVNPNIDRQMGTRHRAALGLAEETDAVVIVVSEEQGVISLAYGGQFDVDLTANELRKTLINLLVKPGSRFFRKDASAEDGTAPTTAARGEPAPSSGERAG